MHTNKMGLMREPPFGDKLTKRTTKINRITRKLE